MEADLKRVSERASTGPATFIAGRAIDVVATSTRGARLQRGRRRSSPEGRFGDAAVGDPAEGLQRSQRRSSPEGAARPRAVDRARAPASTGPATFIAGRTSWGDALCGTSSTLQRGRRRSSPEGRADRARRRSVHMRLQRGRRRSSPEASRRSTGDLDNYALQRGQRRSSPEGGWLEAGEALVEPAASTGPATFIAGRHVRDRHGDRRDGASTGPATFIAGRYSGRRSGSVDDEGFNGAGDVHHRKGRDGRVLRRGGHRASTGPATFIAGRPPPTPRPATARSCFNGAGDVHRRKVRLMGHKSSAMIRLQRGRRRSSPEGRRLG